MSEPESLYSHCNTLKVVFSLFLVQAYLINRNRSVLENTDLFSVSESRSVFSNTDLFSQLSKTPSKSSKISVNTWSYVCIGNQLKCITMVNAWGVIHPLRIGQYVGGESPPRIDQYVGGKTIVNENPSNFNSNFAVRL